MSYFAKVVDGIVINVIRADQDFMDNYIDTVPGAWIQTSYNTSAGVHIDPDTRQPDGGTPLRYNFAGIGFTYDSERDAFIPPKPFASWLLNQDTCLWGPPIPQPDDDQYYTWNEETQTWDEVDDN
jgi:hypothetical protein